MYGNEPTFFLDGRDSVDYGWSDDRVIQEGLARIPDARAPAFFFFHLMSAHLLGEKQEQYQLYQPAAVKNDWEALFRGEYDRESVTNNYDNGVLQADATIKDVFATLDRKGYLKNGVVMILSDHGEGLGDRGPRNFGHITSLYQEFIRIPFLIYDDPPADYAGLQFATQLDAAPTIVDRLGLPVPACWEGASLATGGVPPVSFHQTTLESPCFAVIDHSADRPLKYMQCAVGRREELYDLGADPGEHHDLAPAADPAVLERFRALLREWREQ
jgi:arylsulfatase A-like enzyme